MYRQEVKRFELMQSISFAKMASASKNILQYFKFNWPKNEAIWLLHEDVYVVPLGVLF